MVVDLRGRTVAIVRAALVLALRGVGWRRGLSVATLVVAVAVTAVAAVGPTYLRAAGESILANRLRSADILGRGITVGLDSAPGTNALSRLRSTVRAELGRSPGHAAFGPAITGLQFQGQGGAESAVLLAYRSGFCRHVRITTGSCPDAPGEVAVSASTLRRRSIELGDKISSPAGPLTVVAAYRADEQADYWFDRQYFVDQVGPRATGYDTMFTTRATFTRLGPTQRLDAVVDLPLVIGRVHLAEAGAVRATVRALMHELPTRTGGATVGTTLLHTLDTARGSRQAMTVPVVLIIVELLALCWLVLFLVVANSAEARGGEIALAKLRGLPRSSTVVFGLAEPLLLIAAALPVGLACGWAGVRGLAALRLAPGVPVTLPWQAVLAAVLAAAGGAAAAGTTAYRTLTRPVVEQFRRTRHRPHRRPWLVDAILATLIVAGLVEMSATGMLHGGRVDVVALLVPGLLALVIALLGSRLLPAACRSLFRRTRRSTRLPAFLALRQVARRPATLRIVLVLGTAFGLATFSVAAWAAARSNTHDVAYSRVGAAEVLTVGVPPGKNLAGIVKGLDPTGRHAMAVESYVDFSNSAQQLLAVNPRRFGHIAYWRRDFSPTSLPRLLSRLDPPAPPPVHLTGTAVSATVTVGYLQAGGPVTLALALQTPTGQRIVRLGSLPQHGTRTLRAPLPGCATGPCRLRTIVLRQPPLAMAGMAGTVDVGKLAVRTSGGDWEQVDAGLRAPKRWVSANVGKYAPPDKARSDSTGLHYTFAAPQGIDPAVTVHDHPTPLPTIVTANIAGPSTGTVRLAGLDGNPLTARVAGSAVVLPHALGNGAIIDRTYAERAASNTLVDVTHQVWLAPAAVATFPDKLRAAGVHITRTQRASAVATGLSQAGPALALLLFLAGAGAAALLAAAGAVLNIYLAARGRGYELAALRALGVSRRTLLAALLTEQAVLVGAGAVLGVGSGLLAAWLALPSIPEFTESPAVPLQYSIAAVPIVALIVATVVLLGIAVTVAAGAAVRTAGPQRFREAAP